MHSKSVLLPTQLKPNLAPVKKVIKYFPFIFWLYPDTHSHKCPVVSAHSAQPQPHVFGLADIYDTELNHATLVNKQRLQTKQSSFSYNSVSL